MIAASGGALLLAVTGWNPAGWLERFRALDPGRDVRLWPDAGDPGDIAYVAAWRPPAGCLANLPKLKAVFSLGAGVDHLLDDPDLPDVPIVRVVDDSLTHAMTEYVVLHVLLHFRRHLDYAQAQSAHRWKHLDQPRAGEVAVGILGIGTLGRDAAERLLAFGFRVAGWSRTPKDVPGVRTFAGNGELDDFLAGTDILVSLLPATPETYHLVGRPLIGKLRRDGPLGGPVFVNAGRGATQDEAGLLEALDAGELKAASLDVFETEPLGADSRLWGHPRVVVTPHVAADSRPSDIARYVVDRIRDFESGRPVRHRVERARGY